MAGDWIKLEVTTPDKPEVVMMAAILKADQDAVVGKLIRIWVWADQNSVDGAAVPVTECFLDKLAGRRGFAVALRRVGWLGGAEGSLTFPGFGRHNGKSAKARSEGNRRVAKHRNGNRNVTVETLQKPLPEKRREEKNTPSECPPTPKGGELKQTFDLLSIVHAYPRREGDKEALESVAASIRKGADPAAMLAGTRAIGAVIQSLPSGAMNGFVISAARFFRDERWRDDPATWQRCASGRNGAAKGALNLGGRQPIKI